MPLSPRKAINDKNICIRTHRYLLEPFNEKSNFLHNKLPTRLTVHVVDNIVGRLFPMEGLMKKAQKMAAPRVRSSQN